ncbi:hypothetical protein [Methanobrevibacter sp.]|uniref:hypothetical protein n=1 Tax=Methanobrevibacter sp. TaxID=66852 RepID=UPI00386B7057
MILVMMLVASGANAQKDDVYICFDKHGNKFLLDKDIVNYGKFYYDLKDKNELMDAMLHCKNINALVDTIRSHGEEVFVVFEGYKHSYSTNYDKHVIKKVSVEDFLGKRKKFNNYCKYEYDTKFIINGLKIYTRNIKPNGDFKLEEGQKYYMAWLKNTNERKYILEMISEEESKRLREISKKRLSEIRKEIETSENEDIRQWMERNNYTPQTDVFNVKRWDVGAMNDEIEEIRKELKEHNPSNVKIR